MMNQNQAPENESNNSNNSNVPTIPRISQPPLGFANPTAKHITGKKKLELYEAALKGDWKTAKSIFIDQKHSITVEINEMGDTALHIAAGAKHVSFVKNLVDLSSPEDMAVRNRVGNTALTFAAISGVVSIAKAMVKKHFFLPNIHLPSNPIPLLTAIAFERKDMVSFLWRHTTFELLNTSQQLDLLITAIRVDFYDIALEIVEKKPALAKERIEYGGVTALKVLARKSAIGRSAKLCFCKRFINSCFKRFYNKALMQTLAHRIVQILWEHVCENIEDDRSNFIRESAVLLREAAKVGNVEFLIILVRSYPELLWTVDANNKTIFHVAVENRQESVFGLMYELGGLKDLLVNFVNKQPNLNILYLAGKLPDQWHLNRVSGAAVQMQRELSWFKEVEKIVVFSHRLMKHNVASHLLPGQIDSFTQREYFTKEHQQLLKDGEKWMKNTAHSCMVVATLIATVVFGAGFTMPGGNDDKTGIPIF